MKKTKLLSLLIAGSVTAAAGVGGCLDLNALQSENGTTKDMAMVVDMAMPDDLSMPQPDLTPKPDMTTSDMVTPPDMTPVFSWTSVSPVGALNLYAISGVTAGASTNIYAVGKTATFLKSTGGAFSAGAAQAISVADFNALWLKDATNVYVADGSGNVLLTTDGAATSASWSDTKSGPGNALHAVAGLTGGGKSEAVTGGDDTAKVLLLKPLSATSWSSSMANCAGAKILGVYGGATWYGIVGEALTFNRTQDPIAGCSAPMTTGITGTPDLTAISGDADNDVWAVSRDGQLMQIDITNNGSKLTRKANTTATFNAVFAKANNNVWIVGSKVWQWNGTTLLDKTGDLPTGYTFTGVWTNGANVWITGNNLAVGSIFKH